MKEISTLRPRQPLTYNQSNKFKTHKLEAIYERAHYYFLSSYILLADHLVLMLSNELHGH